MYREKSGNPAPETSILRFCKTDRLFCGASARMTRNQELEIGALCRGQGCQIFLGTKREKMHRTATKYVKQITVINTKVLTTKYTKWS
jgi:hypothetical protein